MNELAQLKWYIFDQNNSGGHFHYDDEVAEKVLIEAIDLEDALSVAERIGIYFNGCASGQDCDCCGDRWSQPWDDDGHSEFPTLWCWHGKTKDKHVSVDEYISEFCPEDERPVRVHYKNGEIHSTGISYQNAKKNKLI